MLNPCNRQGAAPLTDSTTNSYPSGFAGALVESKRTSNPPDVTTTHGTESPLLSASDRSVEASPPHHSPTVKSTRVLHKSTKPPSLRVHIPAILCSHGCRLRPHPGGGPTIRQQSSLGVQRQEARGADDNSECGISGCISCILCQPMGCQDWRFLWQRSQAGM